MSEAGPLAEAAGRGWPGRADLQVHTSAGDGMASARTIFRHVEATGHLDVVAVTDHDDVRGALVAREVWALGGYSFDFVPGIEVTTRSGHLLALWVEEQIPALRGLDETIERIHEAGGLAVIPHPFSMTTRSVGRRALETVLAQDRPETRPDGLEVANPVSVGWDCGERARQLNAERWGLAETGGSDAHFVEMVGIAYTTFAGTTAVDLRRELEAGRTRGVSLGRLPYKEIGMRKLVAQQFWGLSVTPRKLLGRRFGR